MLDQRNFTFQFTYKAVAIYRIQGKAERTI